jgi:hypothetical protein
MQTFEVFVMLLSYLDCCIYPSLVVLEMGIRRPEIDSIVMFIKWH